MIEYSNILGFNYNPSYARTVFEVWSMFDEETITKELALGKAYFPRFNTIRIWLSYEEFRLNEDVFAAKFETYLRICARFGLLAIPVLFNRWHDEVQDFGGLYIDHIVTGANIVSRSEDRFNLFIEKIVGAHKDDTRILLWDICNEPFFWDKNEFTDFIRPYEAAWLRKIYGMCKEAGASQPCSVSSLFPSREVLADVADISDVFLLHPYHFSELKPDEELLPVESFVKELNELKAVAAEYNKPVFTTETCWGALDDDRRAEIVRRTLQAHKACGLGCVVHALWYSRMPDLHTEEDGPVGYAGNLCFIDKDGTIRKGHEVLNEF